jgi:DNA-directed RNA polymerase subunit RPC12/RpoP
MSATATRRPPAVAAPGSARGPSVSRLFRPEPGKRSLEDAILRIYEDLARDGHAACPVCGGRIEPRSACRDCGSELL